MLRSNRTVSFIKFLYILYVLLSPLRLAGAESISSQKDILVFAAASLTDALKEVGKGFEQKKLVKKVYFNFGSSALLQQQIEKGAPADIFISAGVKQVEELERKGFCLQGTRRDLLSNRLVLITPSESKIEFDTAEDIARNIVQSSIKRVAIAEPNAVPAGVYAKESLINLKLWDLAQSRIVIATDVRVALAYVESAEADVGIVYKSDAKVSKKVKVSYEFPQNSHKPILYPAIALKSSKSISTAKRFLDYLSSDASKDLFKKYGFELVD